MRCPYCGRGDQRVLDSRPALDGESIRRRRECPACSRRFTTVERAEKPRLYVVKRGGGREEFSREKVLRSMVLAAGKRPVTLERLEIAAASIERDLSCDPLDEILSVEVGRRVMEELRGIDSVAYIRFASVYQDFDTVSDFIALVDRVRHDETHARYSHLQDALL